MKEGEYVKIVEGMEYAGVKVDGKRGYSTPSDDKKLDDIFTWDTFKTIFQIILVFLSLPLRWYHDSARPSKSLRGRICLVTGSGRGLGREICKCLAEEGAIIACCDVNEETNRETVEILIHLGSKAKAYKMNVANTKEVSSVVEEIEKDLGPIYLLVNNAGIVLRPYKYTEEFIRASFNVNILGPIWTTQTLLPKFIERDEGHIVNISSVITYSGMPCLDIYGATKAALSHYSGSTRMELLVQGKEHIKVTCVHPSLTNTSSDYVAFAQSKMSWQSARYVAEYVVHAVKRNKADCTPNPIIRLILCIKEHVPHRVVKIAMKWLDYQIYLPNQNEAAALPLTDLIKQGIKVEKSA